VLNQWIRQRFVARDAFRLLGVLRLTGRLERQIRLGQIAAIEAEEAAEETP
jgi:hypothetical protein